MNSEIDLGKSRDIEQAISNINKSYDKYERADAFIPLCDSLWNDNLLFRNFFTVSNYTNQHVDIAARLFILYGQDAYTRIKKVMKDDRDNVITFWDDFMIAQINKVEYNATHPWPNKSDCTTFQLFVDAVYHLSDKDLILETMTYVSRSSLFPLFGVKLESAFYHIDAEFLLRRISTMGHNKGGMRRYIHLVKVLSEFDYTAAFQAWGKFYYVFEDVYLEKQPTRSGYTSDLYNIFLFAHQRKIELPLTKTNSTSSYDLSHIRGKEQVDVSIAEYGWDVLHHLFEINADSEEYSKMNILGQSRVYEKLLPDDQYKADQAIKAYKESHSSVRPLRKSCKILKETEAMSLSLSLIIESPKLGINSWKNLLINIEEENREIPKKKIVDILDSPLWNLTHREAYVQTTNIRHKRFPYLTKEVPNLYLVFLEDEWLVEFYFSNCTQYGCATEMAVVLFFLGEEKKYKRALDLLTYNRNLSILPEKLISNINDKIIYEIGTYFHRMKYMDSITSSYHYGSGNSQKTIEMIDLTTTPEHFGSLCSIFEEFYSLRLDRAVRQIADLIGIAEKNTTGESEWFLRRFDKIVSAVKFDPERHIDVLLHDALFFLRLFHYSANSNMLIKTIKLLSEFGTRQNLVSAKSYFRGNMYMNHKGRDEILALLESSTMPNR